MNTIKIMTNEDLAAWSATDQAKTVTKLDLSHTQVSDLYPLSELKQLTYLDLAGTQVSDISPLEGLIDNGLNIYQ